MAHRILSFALALALLVAWLPVGQPVSVQAAPEPLKVGMVTDTGGLGDLSFNDATYQGLLRAQSVLGAEIQALESDDEADFGPNIDALVADGVDVVFTVGFLMTEVTATKALGAPGTVFAGVDEAFDAPGDNLMGLLFKNHEAGYLAGVVAGLGTLDSALDARINGQNKVAFIGGMDIGPIERFEAGFVAGAKSVNPTVEVLISYADAFDNVARGEELALDAISRGADIVFAAAGATGLGAITACQEEGALFIGVDSDQYVTTPNSGDVMLTSAMKRLDGAVFTVAKEVAQGTFVGGRNREFGLAEDGVGLAPFHNFDAAVSRDIRDAVEAARLDVVGGRVVVPTRRTYTGDLITDGVLTVGTSADFPPFGFMDGADYVGFDVELVVTIAQRLGLDYAFVDYPFGDLISALQAGDKIDMIASAMTITAGREALIDFSDPYCEDPWSPGDELGFAFNEANPGLRESVDNVLQELRDDGTYDEIYDRWLAATPKPTTRLALTSAPKTIDSGSTYHVTGQLKAGALALSGRAIVLEKSTNGSSFSAISPLASTGTGGAFTLPVKPATKTWYRARFSGSGTFPGTTSAAVTVSVRPRVGTPVAPKTMKRSKYYTVYGSLKPAHKAGSKPVLIYKYKKVGGKWKSYGYVKAVAYDYKGGTRYKVKMRLTSEGAWRLRAYAPADSGHAKAWSSGYDYVTVK